MKKAILLFLTFAVIGCGQTKGKKETKTLSKNDKIKSNIEAKLKPKLKNPDSYEFVDMEISKTFSVAKRKEIIDKEHVNEVRKLTEEMENSDLRNQAEAEYKFLSNCENPHKDAVYYVDFTAKGSNSFGGTIQNTYFAVVLNDKNKTVVNLKSD